ncbi:sugar ABC transporter substrate-binding protein [Evansella sp. AB-rgal1]|uniref:ABC transporter substrate-binding protein n=1 Tax=Evansella sp. AB-rgal1 TaxID=3242696 RepID=UPI00359DCEAF
MKNLKMKWLIALVVSMLLFVTACNDGGSNNGGSDDGGSSNGDSEGEVTLEYVAFAQPQEQEIYEQIFEQFENDYPHVKVNATFLPPDDFWQQMQTRLGAGTQPDVFYVAPGNLDLLVDNNQILEITDYIDATGIFNLDNVWESGISRYQRDGNIYALPKDVGPFAYGYNQSLFEAAGLEIPSSDEPMDWNEYVEIAKQLTLDANGNNAASPDFDSKNIVQYGADFWWPHPAVWSAGADWINEDATEVTINTPEFKEALQFMYDLRHVHNVVPSHDAADAMTGYVRWLEGTVAMFPIAPWDQVAFWDLDFEYGLMPWPAHPDTMESRTWLGSMGIAVGSNTDHPQEAFNLVAYLSVDEDAQRQMMELGLQVPNMTSLADEFQELDHLPHNKHVWIDVIEEYGKTVPTERTYNSEWWDRYEETIVELWMGNYTVEEYVEKYEPILQGLLDRANEQRERSR